MDAFLFSGEIILPIFILILSGFLLKKFGIISEGFLKGANNFTFQFLFPILMIYNLGTSDFLTDFDGKLVGFVLITTSLVFFVSWPISHFVFKTPERRGVITQAMFRSNFILFGIPICQAIYGVEGGNVAAIVGAFLVPLYNVYASFILSYYNPLREHSLKRCLLEVIKNPIIIGSVIGIIISLCRLRIPEAIPLEEVASMATPLAFLLLGAELNFKHIYKDLNLIFSTVAIRGIILPVIILLIARAMNFTGIEIAVLTAAYFSPVAVSSYVMAKNENSDYELAAEIVAFSALVSLISVFLAVYTFKHLGIF